MESISGDEFDLSDEQESNAQEEKIFVAVRLRPLNDKEIAKNDLSDWECINKTTVVYKSNNQSDRPMHPNAFTFDRVYGGDSTTKQIYDEGVKTIALSVLNGINSSIFAYGQTSSGKTYTMSGITEFAIADIYDYINRHNDREFVLKFSAIEIYNECVKDLLSSDGTQLRLLDDPEKGTVVEKLTEATLRDCNHLKELIYESEAERQIGETALNEMSSRSHQILRLTVESSALEYKGGDNRTLSATVSFVDLAGSERASQTLAAGTRLKEGAHINRSLLTLGTVIRKLSKAGSGHVPYRNSKLTRILHNSLGGNARTAILCTVCPAHSHAEQSRNTLLFGSCAKDVSTNAQVNVVMSDKALVKQLQQELARMEKELKISPGSNNSKSIIRDLELHIEKMEEKIEELTQQRDLAESRLDHLIQVTGVDRNSVIWEDETDKGSRDTYDAIDPPRVGASSVISRQESQPFSDDNSNSPPTFVNQYSPPNPHQQTPETYQKIRINPKDIEKTSTIHNPEEEEETYDKIKINPENGFKEEEDDSSEGSSNIDDEEPPKIPTIKDDVTTEEKMGDDDVINEERQSPSSTDSEEMSAFTRSKSCYEFTSSPPEKEITIETTNGDHNGSENDGIQIIPKSKSEADVQTISQQESHSPMSIIDEIETDQKAKPPVDGSDKSPKRIRKLEDVLKDEKAKEAEMRQVKNDVTGITDKEWCKVFEKQRRDIIRLWDECNTPLIHRTYFFLLFKGEHSDSVYMEVELRRLSFLKGTPSHSTSGRALSRERMMLSKKLLKKYSSTQREEIYRRWRIPLDSKHRRVQLARVVWSKSNDIEHVKESADMVARLVGMVELNQTPKELFGLSFLPTPDHIKTSFWKASISFT